MKSLILAVAALGIFAADAAAGCGHWCRVRVCVPVVRPIFRAPIVAPAPVQVQVQAPAPACVDGQCQIVRRYYATPVRDALFGRYRAVITPQCSDGSCSEPAKPAPEPVGPSVKVEVK